MKKAKFIYTLEIEFKVDKKMKYKSIRKFYEFEHMKIFIDNTRRLKEGEIEQIVVTRECRDIL